MSHKCIACENIYYKRSKKNSFRVFLLPMEAPRRNAWLAAVGRRDLIHLVNDNNRMSYRICETHFEEKYILHSSTRKYLADSAFPTLNRLYNKSRSNIVRSKTNMEKNATKTVPSRKNTVPTEKTTSQSLPSLGSSLTNIIPSVSNTVPLKSTTVPFPNIVPSVSNTVPLMTNSVPVVTNTIPMMTNTIPMMANTIPLVANTLPSMNIPIMFAIGMDAANKASVATADPLKSKGWEQLQKWREQTESNEYSDSFMLFAFSLYKSSSIVYKFIKNTLNLPEPKVLRKFMLPLGTELDPRLVTGLKIKVNGMTPQEKICSVSVDSIPVKPALFYNISNDRIIGFHEVNGIQKPKCAKYAFVMMARGIIVDWQQPIALCFLEDYEKNTELIHWIEEILAFLLKIGLDVRAFITDHRSTIVTPRPRTPVGSFLDYQVAEREIFRIYDAPRLITNLKTCLRTCHLVYKDENVLTTVYLENKINSLAKILDYKTPKHAVKDESLEDELELLQIDFLKQMMEFFKHLQLRDIKTGVDVTSISKMTFEFQETINSILRLRQIFESEGIKFRVTCRLNLDTSTIFFEKIKKKQKSDLPTCRLINSMFRRTFTRYIMDTFNHNEDDLESLLRKIEKYENEDKLSSQTRNVTSVAVGTSDYIFDLPDTQVIPYITRYLYWKCLQRHRQCSAMNLFLLKSRTFDSQHDEDTCNSKAKWTKAITPDFFGDYIFYLEKKFQDHFKKTYIKNVGKEILKGCVYVNHYNKPCSCFPFDYAAKLFMRLRIYHTIKMNNKLMTRHRGDASFNVYNLINK